MSIDWATIVEPQADGSDTAQVVSLVDAAGFAWPAAADAPTIMGAAVRPVDFEPFTPVLNDLVSTTLDADFIAQVEAMLQIWPEYATQLRRLLTRVYPVLLASGPRPTLIGGTSGTRQRDVSQYFGMIYCTADNPHAVAGAIVSGIGNWKLYAMGVKPTDWNDVLLTNDTTQQVNLQLRSGEQQPLGAILHVQYALLHHLDWSLRVAQTKPLGRPNRHLFSIRKNVPRLQRGLDTIQAEAKPTPEGAIFLDKMTEWTMRLVGESQEWL